MDLPPPKKISGRVTRWLSDEVVAAEREAGIELPPPETPTQSATQLAERYGITRVSVWRWSRKAGKKNRRPGRGRAAA